MLCKRFNEEEEVYYYSIQYNTKYNSKWNYNTLIPPRKAPWPGIQGGSFAFSERRLLFTKNKICFKCFSFITLVVRRAILLWY